MSSLLVTHYIKCYRHKLESDGVAYRGMYGIGSSCLIHQKAEAQDKTKQNAYLYHACNKFHYLEVFEHVSSVLDL